MPYVVKPVSDGSSVGVYIIRKKEDAEAVRYEDDREILIEEFIDGKELTCMVLGSQAHVVTELRASDEFYDYHAKYTAGATSIFCRLRFRKKRPIAASFMRNICIIFSAAGVCLAAISVIIPRTGSFCWKSTRRRE